MISNGPACEAFRENWRALGQPEWPTFEVRSCVVTCLCLSCACARSARGHTGDGVHERPPAMVVNEAHGAAGGRDQGHGGRRLDRHGQRQPHPPVKIPSIPSELLHF